MRFQAEKERNITIRLGYGNCQIWKCSNPDCPRPKCYRALDGEYKATPPVCIRIGCGFPMTLLRYVSPVFLSVLFIVSPIALLIHFSALFLRRHISFVDCPGHDVLMGTMLSGASVMDAAILLVAANEPCPQAQTSEHLAAIEMMRLENVHTFFTGYFFFERRCFLDTLSTFFACVLQL